MSVRAHLRLIRWLGPWAGDQRVPAAVARRRVVVGTRAQDSDGDSDGDGQPLEALVYTPTDRPPIGSYLIAHGFNPQGPDDPRCDRFARILCHAGFVVMVPRLHASTLLRVDVDAATDLSRALVALTALPEHPPQCKPAIFSISFGSFAALLTAASHDVGHLVGGLVVFGGYANFADTCRFMLGTNADPTCLPGIAINCADALHSTDDSGLLVDAWRTFVARVWGIPGMKDRARFTTVAHDLTATLPAGLSTPFLQGCGVMPGFAPLAAAALERLDTQAMDPRRHLQDVRCPVHLFHGRRDDVIPYGQMELLAAGLTGTRVHTHLTGLYDHSRGDAAAGRVGQLPAMLKEIRTMAGMVHAMVTSAGVPTPRAVAAVPAFSR